MFVRLLERVEADKWGTVLVDSETDERREFLRAIDAVKKRTQRARKFAALSPEIAERRPVSNATRDDREAVAKAAAENLSPRQRRILELTADGEAAPLWREALDASSARSFREDINDANIRKTMLESLTRQIGELYLPYFIPKDEKRLALPVVFQ